jgi:hypothetical protein
MPPMYEHPYKHPGDPYAVARNVPAVAQPTWAARYQKEASRFERGDNY